MDDAQQIAADAARGFKVLECEQCAQSIKNALIAASFHGQEIELRSKGKRFFMVCLSYDGGNKAISQNGRHLGVRVGTLVFDNLHPDGMEFDAWLSDFDGPVGVKLHRTTDF